MDDKVNSALEFLAEVETFVETLNGYRAMLLDNGYSKETAELMVVQMHGALLIRAEEAERAKAK